MKRLFVLFLISALVIGACTALAADWTDGRSAAQPYSGVPEVDLNTTMGYIMMSPRAKLPVNHFCNELQIYLPREDIVAGTGKLMLYASSGNAKAKMLESVDFSDREAVVIRPMEEAELQDLMWGGGTCIEIHLPISLGFDQNYYVLMEKGCFTAADGKVVSPSIGNPAAWVPVLQGDYGVANLFYSVAPKSEAAPAEEGTEPKAEPTIIPASASEVVINPTEGDYITFDIVLGGDARTAVIYSENDSVQFSQPEYNRSTTVCGTVLMPNIKLGVVFLDEDSQVIDLVNLTR